MFNHPSGCLVETWMERNHNLYGNGILIRSSFDMHNLFYLLSSCQCKITAGIANFVECTSQWAGSGEKRRASPAFPLIFFLLINISRYYLHEKKWITGCILFQTFLWNFTAVVIFHPQRPLVRAKLLIWTFAFMEHFLHLSHSNVYACMHACIYMLYGWSTYSTMSKTC